MMPFDLARSPRQSNMNPTVRYPELRELVRAACSGDRDARTRFADYMACVPALLNSMNARVGFPIGQNDMQDVVQDTLTAAWRKAPDYRGESTLESWVYSFCAFELLAHLRRRRRNTSVGIEAASEITVEFDAVEVAAIRSDIHLALAQLPEQQARIVRWKQLCELTFEEIAAELAIPVPTAKSLYYRGIIRLRELLGADHAHSDKGNS